MKTYLNSLLQILSTPLKPRQFPIHVQLEHTNFCNFRCSFCNRQKLFAENSHLDVNAVQKIVREIAPKRLSLFGFGEPFMNPALPQMIDMAKGHACMVDITTNGTFLSPERCEQIVESGLDILRISLDGATRETFHRIRGADRFTDIVQGIRTLVQTRRNLNAGRPFIRLVVVIVKENYHEITQMLELADRLGVDAINFHPLELIGIEERRDTLLGDTLYENIEKELLKARERERRLRISSNLQALSHNFQMYWKRTQWQKDSNDRRICILPWYFAYISIEGEVYPCCSFLRHDRKKSMGNILESSMYDIWNNEEYQALRSMLRNGTALSAICQQCIVRKTRHDVASNLFGLFRHTIERTLRR